MAWTSLCDVSELPKDGGRYVEIGGFQLAVFVDEAGVHVIDNRCPHAGGSLAGGYIDKGCAVCPWHHWAFDLNSGELRTAPRVKIRVYKTRLLKRKGEPALLQADLPIY